MGIRSGNLSVKLFFTTEEVVVSAEENNAVAVDLWVRLLMF